MGNADELLASSNLKVFLMYVFIDSNQFIADYLLKGAPFRYLLHFLSNSGHTLLLSRLVIEEVENKFAIEALRAQGDFAKIRQRLSQLGLESGAGPEGPFFSASFDLENRIRNHLESLEIVEYAGVPHAEVVQRALSRKKPFDAEGDVGYRDCLLWLSLVQYLASRSSSDSEEVIFISNNWRDFYRTGTGKQSKITDEGKTKLGGQLSRSGTISAVSGNGLAASASKAAVDFHLDLMPDLEKLKQRVLPFDSVATFVDSTIDKREHVINYEKKWQLFEAFIEECGLDVLKRLERENGSVVLEWIFAVPTATSLTILRSEAETYEGVEDFDIYVAEEVGQEIYISCGYDLRSVNVTLIIPLIQYEAHRPEIEAASHVWETTSLDDGTVAVHLLLRCYYQASFSYDPKTESCDGFSLETFSVR